MKPVRPSYDKQTDNYERVQDRIHEILNGGIDRGSVDSAGNEQPGNMNSKNVLVNTPGVANTEFAVTHNLNRVPNHFNITYKNKACDVFDSGTAWTKTQIFLKCSVATVTLKVEIY